MFIHYLSIENSIAAIKKRMAVISAILLITL